jgi:hypothetical protein
MFYVSTQKIKLNIHYCSSLVCLILISLFIFNVNCNGFNTEYSRIELGMKLHF